ncbi:MAG: DUF3298 and DUF4163 domain-containing protein [Bacillota bacterium]
MSYIKSPVQILTRKIISKDEALKIDYPVIIGMEDKSVMEKMNKKIKELVYELIKQQGYYEQENMTMNGWYEIKTNERGVLSISIGNYAYPYHAAHGMTVIKSLNFNISTGKNFELYELFKPNSNFVKEISEMIELQIKERGITLLDTFKGISPNQDYYIADKCLVVYFQLYEIAAYVYGILDFPISIYSIQNIIDNDGLLGVMLM